VVGRLAPRGPRGRRGSSTTAPSRRSEVATTEGRSRPRCRRGAW
jgi:hypothetical protein